MKRIHRTSAQNERQRREHRDDGGRYDIVNPCYCCGKGAGINYFSHRLTDSDEWGDAALILCKKCADATYDMDRVEEYYEYKKRVMAKKRPVKK